MTGDCGAGGRGQIVGHLGHLLIDRREAQLAPAEPELDPGGPQHTRHEIPNGGQRDDCNDQRDNRVGENEAQPENHRGIFRHAERDIGNRLGRGVSLQADGRLERVRGETEPRGKQTDDDIENRIPVAQHHHSQQSSAHRTDRGVHRIPGRVNPRNFVRRELHGKEQSGSRQDPRISQHFQPLVFRGEGDPIKADGQTGEKDGQVKIQPGQSGQADRDTEKLEDFHGQRPRYPACRGNPESKNPSGRSRRGLVD